MIVGDASPLITFGRLGLLDLVFTLVGVVNVPEAVMAEVTAARAGLIADLPGLLDEVERVGFRMSAGLRAELLRR